MDKKLEYTSFVRMIGCCHSWSHWLLPVKFYASVMVPQAHVWVPSQRPPAPSVMSVANDKGVKEYKYWSNITNNETH